MGGRAQCARLDDGRLHLHHGPIDLVIEADGEEQEVSFAYAQAQQCFDGLLDELVAELAILRAPLGVRRPRCSGPVARRMLEASWPGRREILTPMIAVAGAVADEVLGAMTAGRTLSRAHVNNGGDIALHLAPGESYRAGLVASTEDGALAGSVRLDFEGHARGVATSGWRGRSHSFGIADAVTVLAANAAAADAAATLVANAVDTLHPSIVRKPAIEIDDFSDLGDRPVTVDVPPLDAASVARALDAGAARAKEAIDVGGVIGAALFLQGQSRVVDAEHTTHFTTPALAS